MLLSSLEKTMSTSKKKTVKTTKKKVGTTSEKKKSVKPTESRFGRGKVASKGNHEMLFEKQNYMLMGLSLLVIFVGFLLMSGGSMPSPDVWDEGIIYSFRRITLAPFVVLAGLILFVVAIFKK